MKQEEYIVNLDLPAEERWHFLVDYKEEVNDLLQCYLDDFKGSEFIFEGISEYKKAIISQEYLKEIEFIASISKFSADEVLIANLYYDVLKFYFGCTAFAFEKNGKVMHSRNLDWSTKNNLLSKHSKVFDFQRSGKTIFKTIGWVGFIGALSGIKPHKFSLTLNAVLSNDSPEIATPISFLLRDILTSANTFKEAKQALESITIASDCLILLSGTKANEIVVIERTPKRFSTREATNNFIVVTNDYKQLENNTTEESLLQATSCDRFDRTTALLNEKKPKNLDECIEILKDEKVMMKITVQQMVFDNNTGEIKLIKT
jgi:acid ceramidase/N-acylethanolamine-hydrolysing acid amidase